MAFDSNRKRVVLFGGAFASGNFADTWEWDGSFGMQSADTGPGARAGQAMVYDDAREVRAAQ
jgi:hypothetical protein